MWEYYILNREQRIKINQEIHSKGGTEPVQALFCGMDGIQHVSIGI